MSRLVAVLRVIGPERRRRFVLVWVVSLAVTALEAVAALLILVLMRLVLEPGRIPDLPVLGDPTRWFPGRSHEELVLGFAVVFAVFFLVRGLAFLAQQFVMVRVSEMTGVQVAERLVGGYLAMPYAFHLRRNSAELIRNAYDDVQQMITHVLLPTATLFSESALVAALVVVLLMTSPAATLAAAVLLGLTVWATFRFTHPRLERLGRLRQEGVRDAIQHLQQALGGLRDIKVLHTEAGFRRAFSGARSRMARAHYQRGLLIYVPRTAIETAFLLFVLTFLAVGVLRDAVSSVLPVLGVFAYAGLRLQPSLQKIALSLNNFRYAEDVVDRLLADLALVEGVDGPGPDRTGAGSDGSGSDEPGPPGRVLPFEDAVRFEGVGFRYGDEGPPALRDIDLVIRRGERVGVAGSTGGGKTTLLDLLCGLLTPTTGCLTVDGIDVARDPRAWQRNLGVVHQSSFLVDDTLRRNIAFGVPDGAIDEERVRRAVALAELTEVITGLPAGLDTEVGERGVRLSGGQRQRVTLARALYRRPRLLVLDEGTSALDNTTEARVMANLEALGDGTTLVIVAHRLTTIRSCDRILLLEAGRIRAVGTYDELRRRVPAFLAMSG